MKLHHCAWIWTLVVLVPAARTESPPASKTPPPLRLLVADNASEVKLTPHSTIPSAFRLEPKGGDAIDLFALTLASPEFEVVKETKYVISFWARADSPRTLVVTISRNAPPFSNLGVFQELSLTSDWQQFRLEAAPTEAGVGEVRFFAGKSAIPLEIASLRYGKSGDAKAEPEWMTQPQRGGGAITSPLADPKGGIRITFPNPPGPNPWDAIVVGRKLNIKKGETHGISFEARADKPRSLALTLSKLDPPFTTTTTPITVEVTTEWQPIVRTLTVTEDASAEWTLQVGGSAEALELRQIKIDPK